MNEINESEERIVLLALGNSNVGKTTFILRFTENSFEKLYLSTIGIDFKTKEIIFKDKQYKLFFYDTSGQERYRSISHNMIKNADGIIIMYDITKQSSFDSVNDWVESVKVVKGDDCPMILLGNKMDLEEKRQIKEEAGKKLADKFGIEFLEISNKENINIKEAINSILGTIIEIRGRTDSNFYSIQSTKLSKNKINSNKNNKTCC